MFGASRGRVDILGFLCISEDMESLSRVFASLGGILFLLFLLVFIDETSGQGSMTLYFER